VRLTRSPVDCEFAVRLRILGHPTFTFLLWNLFLARTPFVTVVLVGVVSRRVRPLPLLVALGVVWVAACAIPQQPTGPPPPSAPRTWKLTFNDEFNAFDSSKWTHKFWWNGDTFWPTKELQVYKSSQLAIENGNAVITAERATDLTNFNGHTANSDGEPFSWVSDLLTTGGVSGVQAPGFAQKFGYFEARIKMPPAAAGFWCGFWMQGVVPNGANSSYPGGWEIDTVEVVPQNPSRMEMHLHGVVAFRATKDSATPLLGGDFHVYGLDWEPGFIAWYLDGVKVAQYTGTAFDAAPPHYMMLNFTIGGAASWPGAPTSGTPSPSTMLVDYVRAWQH
jgi:beta-glucanase (GH16 family)